MTGYYPHKIKRFVVLRNAIKNCYEIKDIVADKIHRSGISTRRDAENQCVGLNAKYGVMK